MSLEIAWKQNILVKDSSLLKLLLVVFGFGSQTFVCGFSRQNICSVLHRVTNSNMLISFKVQIIFKLLLLHRAADSIKVQILCINLIPLVTLICKMKIDARFQL